MSKETFLIRLINKASNQDINYLISIVTQINGRVEMYCNNSKVIIATFDNSYKEKIMRIRCVKLVGGVTFRGLKRYKKNCHKKSLK